MEARVVDFMERVEVLLEYTRIKPSRVLVFSIPMWAILSYKTDWYNFNLFKEESHMKFREREFDKEVLVDMPLAQQEICSGDQSNITMDNAIANMGHRIHKILQNKHNVKESRKRNKRNENRIDKTLSKLKKNQRPGLEDYVLKGEKEWGLKMLFFLNWFVRNVGQHKQVFCNLQFNLSNISSQSHLPYDESSQSFAVHFLRLKSGLLDIWYKIVACSESRAYHCSMWTKYITDMLWTGQKKIDTFTNQSMTMSQSVLTCPQDMGPMALLLLYKRLLWHISSNVQIGTGDMCKEIFDCGGETARMLSNAFCIGANFICIRFCTSQTKPISMDFTQENTLCWKGRNCDENTFYISTCNGDVCFYNPRLTVITGAHWFEQLLQDNPTYIMASDIALHMLGFCLTMPK